MIYQSTLMQQVNKASGQTVGHRPQTGSLSIRGRLPLLILSSVMSRSVSVLLLVALACLARFGSAQPINSQAELKELQAILKELQAERRGQCL